MKAGIGVGIGAVKEMYVKGVTREGKRVNLSDDLNIRLPYGGVYSKTENGSYYIQMLALIPSNYCDGDFSIPDHASAVWSILFEKEPIVCNYTKTPEVNVMELFQEDVKNVAERISGNSSPDLFYEELSYSRTIKHTGGDFYKHTIPFRIEKGGIRKAETTIEKNSVIYHVVMKIRIGIMEPVFCNWVVAGILNYPKAVIYRGQFRAHDMDRAFSKEIIPILQTLQEEDTSDLTEKWNEKNSLEKSTEKEQQAIEMDRQTGEKLMKQKLSDAENRKISKDYPASYEKEKIETKAATGGATLPLMEKEKKTEENLLKDSISCYNQKSVRKATEDMKEKTKLIGSVLTQEPKTAEEINQELGTEYSALQIANAIKLMKHSYSKKVMCDKIDGKGKKYKKEYTAYFIYDPH